MIQKFKKCKLSTKLATTGHIVLSLFWLLFHVGCQTTGIPEANLAKDVVTESDVLGAGDIISLAFTGASEFDQSQKIRLDGKVSLPMIGEVTAAQKTIKSFQSELSGLYENELQNPEVVISLVQKAARVYVNGQVLVPGKILLDREMTALEAIMESGGFTELANQKKVTLIRQEDDKYKRYNLNFKDEERSVFYLKSYDMITVSRRVF